MDEQSSAQHGSFYITNIVEVKSGDVKESGGQVAGGGASLYYSHALRLLFFAYAHGKNFAAALSPAMDEITALFPITFKG
jgi:E3 ubiquitin-protein ligase UBR4